ncbi:hypothetical protein [Helicobacter cappadocius]|uniref:Autotransporter domain-containing protein n=1 Tax=Helicobacter cappadocius TaxID=3063998 RepID=A0AA90PKK6_9HELI|nr:MULTISPECIES: hypothetical protein [unclassified Helicobacter]MDO7253335.1 hypothetical protein [Helicobacter sp. faydin-H75]MDP2539235.1 hypothetical protein [Helicobacter sp. faydin-H76]
MKKLAIFSLLALTLSVSFARPPVEGDVLDSNNFVVGVDASLNGVYRKNNPSTPYLYGKIDGQYITYPTFASNSKQNSGQIDVDINLNARYGILDYFEIYANANGYYQNSNVDNDFYSSKDISSKSNIINFGNANIGLMATLYKGETFRVIIGDNSDIISNMAFYDFNSQMNYFGGHTFFLNLITQKVDADKFASFTSQFYYRLNLTQKYKSSLADAPDFKFKNGDEAGVRFLWQFGKENSLGFIGGNVAFRAADRLDGNKPEMVLYNGQDYSSIGVGFSLGGKKDINDHLGYKISVDFMSYALDYNTSTVGINFGLYFK